MQSKRFKKRRAAEEDTKKEQVQREVIRKDAKTPAPKASHMPKAPVITVQYGKPDGGPTSKRTILRLVKLGA